MKATFAPAAIAACVLACGARAQPLEVTLDALRLSEQVWLLRSDSKVGNPTTLAVIAGREATLIDANLLDAAPVIDRWLRERGVERVRYVATTHYHADHTHGLEHHAREGATVIATPAQRRRLATQGLLSDDGPPLQAHALPTLLVEGRLSLSLGAETLVLFTTPVANAHTDGDLFARLEQANVLYGGDHLFAGRFPIVDRDGGGELRGYLENVQAMIELADAETRIVAGHGSFAPEPIGTYDRASLAAWRERLVESIAIVRRMRDAGLTLEQARAQGLPESYADMSQRPRFVSEAAWIGTVYDALAAGEI
jgi:glyoxylase-like metal-dependent hydrolase (beta-lactamase superfamily II)